MSTIRVHGALVDGVTEDLGPMLDEVGSGYLPLLVENARAWAAGRRRFDARVQGVPYRKMLVSRYRVWCLDRLRGHLAQLDGAAHERVRAWLRPHGCWEALTAERVDARYPEQDVPFRGHKVHYHGRS